VKEKSNFEAEAEQADFEEGGREGNIANVVKREGVDVSE